VSEQITLTVHYACRGCGLLSRKMTVPMRPADQGMLAWLRMLQRMMAVDHARVCPHCDGKQLMELPAT
jgi:hypothetical protein